MSDKFKYQCKRRSDRPHPVTVPGAGSGGDAGDGDNVKIFDGMLNVGCSSVLMSAVGTTGNDPESPLIEFISGGPAPDGKVYVSGSQGVRITSGPPGQPKLGHPGVNGVEIAVGETQSITLDRGLVDGVDQHIQMDPGLIVIDGGSGTVALLSTTQITLSVAGGTSSIVLTPLGIVMQGPVITLN